jgi:predicted enzyme related to lactoylglutathione lyase
VIHFEIGCKDLAKTRHFFSELFGWQTETAGPAAMIDTKSDAGIAGHITALGHGP